MRTKYQRKSFDSFVKMMSQFSLRNFFLFCVIINHFTVDIHGRMIYDGSTHHHQGAAEGMCQHPEHNANSQNNVTEPWSVVGTKASYTCDAGYYFFGQHDRVCEFDGKWSGEAPFCMKKISSGKNVTCTGAISQQLQPSSDFLLWMDDKKETCTELPTSPTESVNITVDLLETFSGIRAFHFIFGGGATELPIGKLYIKSEYGWTTEVNPKECKIQSTVEQDYQKFAIYPHVALSARYATLQLKPTVHTRTLCEVEIYSEKGGASQKCFPVLYSRISIIQKICNYSMAPSVQQCFDISNQDDTQAFRNRIKNTMTFGGNCYTFDGQTESWNSASKWHCKSINGGKLAHDISPETNSALISFMKTQNFFSNYWLGGHMAEKFGLKGIYNEWQWLSGDSINKQLWNPIQQSHDKQCIGIHAPSGTWMNFQCTGVMGSICQAEIQRCGFPEVNVGAQITSYIQTGYINTTVGAHITYGCADDYVLVGEGKRYCLPSGTWSGNSPYCMHKDAAKHTGAMEMSEGALIGIIIAGIVIGLLIIVIIITLIIIKRRGSFKQTIHFKKEPHGESNEVLDQAIKKETLRLSSSESQNYQSVHPDQQQTDIH